MLTDPESKKVYWHSRRGMLELDLLLVPFVEQEYENLPPEQQANLRELLSCEDMELLSWLLSRGSAIKPELRDIVQRIVAHEKNSAAD